MRPRTRSLPAGSDPERRHRRPVALAGLRLWVRWAARSAITGRSHSRNDPAAGRFTGADVDRLLAAAWANFDRLAPTLPREPTLGSRQNVMLACLTLSMLEALVAEDVERGYAIELIGDACWKVYAQWGQIPRAAVRILTRDPAKRMRISVDMFLRYPFNAPGYRYANVSEPEGRGLDMLRCPVAEYLRADDASDLTVGTWCNLDFQLARMWGGELRRGGTLAGGGPCCDFRFRAAQLSGAGGRRGPSVGVHPRDQQNALTFNQQDDDSEPGTISRAARPR